MKSLLIALLIMAPLYLFLCQEQGRQLDALSDAASDADSSDDDSSDDDSSDEPVTEGSSKGNPLQSISRPLDKAKGVEAMLNQGVEDRMRNIDGLEKE